MKRVKLLDCTLRDGGYVNDWNFGHSTMRGIYKRLDKSGTDYIEIGFLDERRPFDRDRSIQPDTKSFDKIYCGVEKKHAVPIAMIDFGTCGIGNIANADESFIDGIRVIFHKEKIDDALPFCEQIKGKGYKLFIQAISITSYSDKEMLEYIQRINQVHPYAFSIVDTYGLLDNQKMLHYFDLLDNNLLPDIIIGYHDHNNFQLAFSNTMKFMERNTERRIIGDASIYGMGKSAGNCPIELLAKYMNDALGANYDINQYLEIFDTDLSQIYQKQYWGYRYNFYISAMQNCHPKYVEYLLEKKTLTVSDINAILSCIPDNIKLHFNAEYIEKAYTEYQSRVIDDTFAVEELRSVIQGKSVLLLGPGTTIEECEDEIKAFISEYKPLIFSVNFNPHMYECDFVFLSNSKRYMMLSDTDLGNKTLIVTSNVTDYEKRAKYILNYAASLRYDIGKNDNALLLLISNMIRIGVQEVYLAGFDGYTESGRNYAGVSYDFAGNEKYKVKNNAVIAAALKTIGNSIKLHFLTKTLYK